MFYALILHIIINLFVFLCLSVSICKFIAEIHISLYNFCEGEKDLGGHSMINLKNKKRFVIPMTLLLSLTMTSCGKKAKKIDDYDNSNSSTEEIASTEEDSTTNPTTDKSGSSLWIEHINGDESKGYPEIFINSSLRDISKYKLTTSTVNVPHFDKEFRKNICEKAFDSGDIEVYDYDHMTKKLYDDKISLYQHVLSYYDDNSSNTGIMSNYYETYDRQTMPVETSEVFSKDKIEYDIDKLNADKEKAPETIENDYSYDGYLGKINGEEYYVHFGNRNFDEYVSSPETYQTNNRVVTIMKKDLAGSYVFHDYPDEIKAQADATNTPLPEHDEAFENEFYDSIVDNDSTVMVPETTIYQKGEDGVFIHVPDEYFAPYSPKNSDEEEALSKADAFLDKLGFSDYKIQNSGTLTWTSSISPGLFYINDYKFLPLTKYARDFTGGYTFIYRFDFGSDLEEIAAEALSLHNYTDDGDVFNFNSFIKVYVNDNGVLGCHIINPMTLVKNQDIDKTISFEDMQNIVRESVSDKSLWNNPATLNPNIELKDIVFTEFPIKSNDSDTEYTYTPCYIIGNLSINNMFLNNSGLSTDNTSKTPVIIINAIDGSIVSVKDSLDEYPIGANNANVGTSGYYDKTWPMFHKTH